MKRSLKHLLAASILVLSIATPVIAFRPGSVFDRLLGTGTQPDTAAAVTADQGAQSGQPAGVMGPMRTTAQEEEMRRSAPRPAQPAAPTDADVWEKGGRERFLGSVGYDPNREADKRADKLYQKRLGPVYNHRVQRTTATALIIAAKQVSVFS
jgi:hypothetical protein